MSLVLDAQDLFHTQDELLFCYTCPNPSAALEECSGLQLWPQIFCSTNKSISEREHWPNVVSLIIDQELTLRDTHAAPYHHYEPRIGTTYFLATVEQGVLVVCIMLGKRAAADPAVSDFVKYLQLHLSNRAVYNSL